MERALRRGFPFSKLVKTWFGGLAASLLLSENGEALPFLPFVWVSPAVSNSVRNECRASCFVEVHTLGISLLLDNF